MPRRSISPLLSTLLLLGLGSEALALQGDHQIPWPSSLGTPGTFGRTVAGDMSGNGVADVVVLVGSQPVFLFDPQLHEAVFPISITGVQDIDMVPGALATLALAQGNTLVLANLVQPTTPPLFGMVTAFTGTSWTTLDLIRAADLDGDGDFDFVGIADGDIVFQVVNDPAGTYTLDSSFQVAGPVRELGVVSWNSAGLAIAVHSDFGVKVYDQLGVVQDAFSGAVPGNAMGVIHTTRMFDRLAWQRFDVEERLYTLAEDPALLEGPIDFDFGGELGDPAPVSDVVAVVGCDENGDKQDDVIVVHQGAHQAVVFSNDSAQSPAIATTPSAAVAYGPAGAAPNQFAHPVAADLNHDGKEDLLFPVQDTEEFALRFGPFVESGVPENGGGTPFGVDSATACCDGAPAGEIHLHLNVHFDDPRPAVTHANVIVWRRPNPTANLQAMAIHNKLISVTSLPDPLPVSLTIEVDETCGIEQPFEALYYAEFRLVKANGSTIQKVLSRTYTGCWASDTNLELAGHWDPQDTSSENLDVDCLEEGTGGPIKLGGFVPGVDLPSFGGAFPVVPTPTQQ